MSNNLPPLPNWLSQPPFRDDVIAYARAAIEADQVSRDVPAGWRDLLISLTEHAAEAGDHTEESFRRGVVHLANRAHKFLAAPQPQPVQEPGACAMCGALQDDQVITQPVQAQPSERCPNCDDTGDVHSIDGEWRGVCHCNAGKSINAQANPSTDSIVQAAVIRALDEANVRNDVLRGMCIEVALENARDMAEGLK